MIYKYTINSEISNDNKAKRIEASVKWYSPYKGYGFLTIPYTLEDAMIHFSTLEKVKCPYLKEGDRIVCDIVLTKSGLQVLRVIEVKYGSSEVRSLPLLSLLTSCDPESLEDVEGTLKWYNPEKGYGFITPNNGPREIFVHFYVMRQMGYKTLPPGTRILAKVSHSERGPEARILRILYEGKEKKAC